MNSITTTLIIPVYNEAETIKSVIDTAIKSAVFDEIICVDDGSTDDTAKVIKTFDQVKLIRLESNQGKAYAVTVGIKQAKGKYIILCDGDLISVKPEHFIGILKPLQTGIADHVIAIRQTDFPFLKQLSGERGFKRDDILPYLDEIQDIGYGLEVFLNNLFKSKRTYWFWYPGLMQNGKAEGIWLKKLTLIDAYLQEGYEISREIIRLKQKPIKEQLNSLLSRHAHIINQTKRLRRALTSIKNRLTTS